MQLCYWSTFILIGYGQADSVGKPFDFKSKSSARCGFEIRNERRSVLPVQIKFTF